MNIVCLKYLFNIWHFGIITITKRRLNWFFESQMPQVSSRQQTMFNALHDKGVNTKCYINLFKFEIEGKLSL